MKSQVTKECWKNKVFLDLIIVSVASIFVFAFASIFHPFEKLVNWSLKIRASFHEGITVLKEKREGSGLAMQQIAVPPMIVEKLVLGSSSL